MPRRSRDWNQGVAQDLRDQEFAREFLMAAMESSCPPAGRAPLIGNGWRREGVSPLAPQAPQRELRIWREDGVGTLGARTRAASTQAP